MADTCELAGMIWSQTFTGHKYRICDDPEYDSRCSWCDKVVCFNHSFHGHNSTICDECTVLNKSIVINGKTLYARSYATYVKSDKLTEYYTQYSGMCTKAAKM